VLQASAALRAGWLPPGVPLLAAPDWETGIYSRDVAWSLVAKKASTASDDDGVTLLPQTGRIKAAARPGHSH